MKNSTIPLESYGVSSTTQITTLIDEKLEELMVKGFCVLESKYDEKTLKIVSSEFNSLKKLYNHKFKDFKLKRIDEQNTLRLPLALERGSIFRSLAFHKTLLALVSKAIKGTFILNQQNGIINPPRQKYNQGKWHRDLPYQHYISSRPLALNALFCVDDFTTKNGSTFVLQGSHKSENYPSQKYIMRNALQITAKKGSYIVLDCMLFHTGGKNLTNRPRRAVNHVFTIPFFKQQISIPKSLTLKQLTAFQRNILGFPYLEPESLEKYFESRDIK